MRSAHSPDRTRYATFSYIPSARLLRDIAAAKEIPLRDNGLVVVDSDTRPPGPATRAEGEAA